MIRKSLVAVTIVGGVFLLLYLGGGDGLVSLVFGWLVLGYLVRAAWPVILRDVHWLMSLLPSSMPVVGRRSVRGDHL